MPKAMKKRSKKAGLPPGTLVYIGEKERAKTKITVLNYQEEHFREIEARRVEECASLKEASTVTWINVDGISQVEVLEKLGGFLGLHHLTLEDIVNTDQRPKLEDYGDYLYIVLKMLLYSHQSHDTAAEQVSLILGPDYVISFQEAQGDVFDPIRERIRAAKGRIRKMGADYLAYSLLDAVVDNYFIILEKLGEKIEVIQDELVTDPAPATLRTIHNLKREIIFLRKAVWPLREVVSRLERGESSLIKESTQIYLRDVYDHTVQAIDTIETFRDILSGMLDIYLSSISNRLNEVMKLLTIIATVFIPLTFIVGLYGMNFKYMPELQWRWGYPVVLLVILVIGVSMLIYFRRKKWL